MRWFDNKKIELLAPAGNFEIFKEIVKSKCDAVYFGGEALNMRMIRKGFNFTNSEIKSAVEMAKDLGKATYITVNSLIDEKDLKTLDEYLDFLMEVKPTGIIVQDAAVLKRAKQLKEVFELHASVMMNVHNLDMIKSLEEIGFKRVVLSRDSTLADASYFSSNTNMELEYFTHGDMCVCHGSLCYYSSMVFGMSSNQGRCMKPCRWPFRANAIDSYPLAVKDMCMISNLPQMINSGITSFKIEGRMREKDFIVNLVNMYGDVIDKYSNDPFGYSSKAEETWIYENRKRDLSTAYAFGNPGKDNINKRYEGTGKFYSTGKVFSNPKEEESISDEKIYSIKEAFAAENSLIPGISVRVSTSENALAAISEGVDRIYLSGDVFLPNNSFSVKDILNMCTNKNNSKVYLAMPKMTDDLQLSKYRQLLSNLKKDDESFPIDGLLLSNIGGLESFRDFNLPLIGDYTLNILNSRAASFYTDLGFDELTPSIELGKWPLCQILSLSLPFEPVVFGRLSSMYMSYDLYSAYGVNNSYDFVMNNEAGEYLVKKDVFGMNHLLMQKYKC